MRTFSSLLSLAAMLGAQDATRISSQPDGAQAASFPSHLPHWANASNDAGLIPAAQMLDHLTLVLSRTPQQQLAFESFLEEQQDPASPNYHRWLTPAEVGERFGPAASDMDAITGWLKSQGLHVNWVSPSRMFIGFGGTAAEIGSAFQTQMRSYKVDGAMRMSVSSEPVIPQPLKPLIKAIHGLYTIEDRPFSQMNAVPSDGPQTTTGSGTHYIAPEDFATIYDIPNGDNAPAQTIGIVGRSRTDPADFTNFMTLTGSSFSLPTEIIPTAFGGVDPGPALTAPPAAGVSTGDQSEATLDVLRAGSVAPGASLLLVVATNASGGIEADAQYLVQTSPAPAQVMTISFGLCESSAGAAAVDYWDTLFMQAAAEGISTFVSSGDSGASGCDAAFATPPASPKANSPNYICSSSYVTCVGGTEFNDVSNPGSYWNPTNGPYLNSAIGYIPEGGWNEPLSATSAPQVSSSGGGVSSVIATPAWQTGPGVPTARAGRYTPDIAFSSSCHDGYFGCFAAGGGSCVVGANQSFYFVGFCGTSAAAPSMAGIAALLDQEKGSAQGNLNPGIYRTWANNPTAFHDATVASSGVASCDVNTPSMCNNSIPSATAQTGGQAGYLVGTGYDEVTGIGSLDAGQFFEFYAATITPTVTVTPPSTSVTFQQTVPVAITVSGGAGNPTPTGSVVLTSGTYTSAATSLSAGSATINIPPGALGIESQFLTVTYTPDSASSTIYGSATGTNTVFISLLNPTVTLALSSSNITTAQADTATVTVSGGSGNPTPTGNVILENYGFQGTLTGGVIVFNIPAGIFAAGTDTVTAYYSPDTASSATYNSNTGSTNVTVTKTATYTPVVTLTPATTFIAQAQPLQVAVAVAAAGSNPTPTGSIQLVSGSYSSAPAVLTGGSATITIPAGSLAAGSPTVFALYTPDAASSATYNNASGLVSITVANLAKVTPVVGVSASTAITTVDSLKVFISVTTAGSYPSATGSVTLTSGTYSSGATALSLGGATITIPAGSLATGDDTLTVSYTPDDNSSGIYSSATGTAAVTVTTPPPPSFTVSGTAISILPGASTGNTSTITLTPSGGFTGAVSLTCAITPVASNDPAQCSIPASVTISGTAAQTVTLAVSTTASTTAFNQQTRFFWPSAGSAALAVVLLFGIPARRRQWRNLIGAIVLLAALAGGLASCGGSSGGGGGGGGGNPGTTAGTYTITVTGTSGSITQTGSVTLTVE